MKVKEIIDEVVKLVGATSDVDRNIILRCFNLQVSNIFCNHIDLVDHQTFLVTDGKIHYDLFRRTFLKPKKVTQNNKKVSYDLYMNYLGVPNGKTKVEYCYVPQPFQEDEDIGFLGLSKTLFVLGTLAEYAMICGMFNEARTFNKQFEDLLFGSKGYTLDRSRHSINLAKKIKEVENEQAKNGRTSSYEHKRKIHTRRNRNEK